MIPNATTRIYTTFTPNSDLADKTLYLQEKGWNVKVEDIITEKRDPNRGQVKISFWKIGGPINFKLENGVHKRVSDLRKENLQQENI